MWNVFRNKYGTAAASPPTIVAAEVILYSGRSLFSSNSSFFTFYIAGRPYPIRERPIIYSNKFVVVYPHQRKFIVRKHNVRCADRLQLDDFPGLLSRCNFAGCDLPANERFIDESAPPIVILRQCDFPVPDDEDFFASVGVRYPRSIQFGRISTFVRKYKCNISIVTTRLRRHLLTSNTISILLHHRAAVVFGTIFQV